MKSPADKPEPIKHLSTVGRRDVIKMAAAAMAALLVPGGCTIDSRPSLSSQRGMSASKLGFGSIPISKDDRVYLPAGYKFRVLNAWGDPIQPNGPAFQGDAGNPASEQWQQAGTHHDGMEFFSLDGTSNHGLLAINHESFDDGMIHKDGEMPPSLEKTEKGKACCGVSVIEVKRHPTTGEWQQVPSSFARRVTAQTPMLVMGPAAGHDMLKTSSDASASTILGTIANCASGRTPWGTYLTCEENFQDFFKLPDVGKRKAGAEARYMKDAGLMCHWHMFDDRFDFAKEPNEFNRFGWVVEIDPSGRQPCKKRTALGRFRHENAGVTLSNDGHVVVYMGDDARFEHIYKFVSAEPYDANRPDRFDSLLNEGTLYAAQFLDDGNGRWMPLQHGEPGLGQGDGFKDQADVVIHARLAATAVGATTMDRPEWLIPNEETGYVYASLTNNTKRGLPDQPGTNEANPRAKNSHGQIVRWKESDGDSASSTFTWEMFRLCGEGEHEVDVSAPDGLHLDKRGVLWVQTDVSTAVLNNGIYEPFGNNQVVAIDPESGDTRRFLTGPVRCEVTGLTTTPDGKTMFVNIQHPGQPDSIQTKDPSLVTQHSSWPDTESDEVRGGRPKSGRPRSATLVIEREDGGVIGA